MSLKTFLNNPTLGGFGNETDTFSDLSGGKKTKSAVKRKRPRLINDEKHRDGSQSAIAKKTHKSNNRVNVTCESTFGCDAFAQIIKELVDNAVEACIVPVIQEESHVDVYQQKRVRVTITENKSKPSMSEDSRTKCDTVLQITVSDNGCGMEDIEQSVNAFRSTKNSLNTQESTMTGRFGIGLTLCLLHAQRSVPQPYSSITSATASSASWTKVSILVDTENDKVICSNKDIIPKKRGEERSSGTVISLLLPGGLVAEKAWPRLAEYFARYQLSIELDCSIEIYAPTLSAASLLIVSSSETDSTSLPNQDNSAKEDQDDLLSEQDFYGSASQPYIDDLPDSSTDGKDQETHQLESMMKAVSKYLGKSISQRNISSHSHPIRRHDAGENIPASDLVGGTPSLRLFLVVHQFGNRPCDTITEPPPTKASAILLRFVNNIPLMDSPEAAACGLYHAMTQNQCIWNSFGIELKPVDDDQHKLEKKKKIHRFLIVEEENETIIEENSTLYRSLHIPRYDLHDTALMSSLIKENDAAHGLFDNTINTNHDLEIKSSKNKISSQHLVPVGGRLGNVLVIAHLNANLKDLSFPSLSKGRLPRNDPGINEAFEACLSHCLQKLQVKNPALFPSNAILKREHRDNRYVPLIASALASLCNRSACPEMKQTVLSWSNSTVVSHQLGTLTKNLDCRIRNVLSLNDEVKLASKSVKGKEPETGNIGDESSDHDSVSTNASLSRLLDNSRDLRFDEIKINNECCVASTDEHLYGEW